MSNQATNNLIPQEKLDEISEIANENIEIVFEELGIDVDDFKGYGSEIRIGCPIHDGKDANFSYNVNYKCWRCYSHQCHKDYYNGTVFGLVCGVLSRKNNCKVGFIDAVNWLCKVLQIDNSNINVCTLSEEEKRLNSLLKEGKIKRKFSREKSKTTEKFHPIPLEKVISKIKPSKYFLDLGFTLETQKKFYISHCDKSGKPMYMRSYALVTDEENKNVIGVTGRIIYDVCDLCGLCHKQGNGCPQDNPNVRWYTKWLHYGFCKSQVLYNYYNAKESIQKTGVAIITEGPKDTWWLDQNGIHNSCSIFGLDLSDYHLKKLVSLGTQKLVIALDNDERGISAIENIQNKVYDYFKLVNLKNFMGFGQDIADIKTNIIEKELKPFLERL